MDQLLQHQVPVGVFTQLSTLQHLAEILLGALHVAGAELTVAGVQQRHWIITVQVEGFGDSSDDDRKKRKDPPVSYNSSSPVSVLGFGQLGSAQRTYLTDDEKSRL